MVVLNSAEAWSGAFEVMRVRRKIQGLQGELKGNT